MGTVVALKKGLDRDTLDLPGSQQQLLEAVRAAAPNKPFIAVLLHGRPLSVNWLDQHADAIITGCCVVGAFLP